MEFYLSNSIPSHILGVQEKYVTHVDKKKLIYFQTPMGKITHLSDHTMTVLFSTLDKKNRMFKNDIMNMFKKTQVRLQHQCPNHKIELVSPMTNHHDDKFTMIFDKSNHVKFFECDKVSAFDICVNDTYDFIIQFSKVKIISVEFVCEKHAKMIYTLCQIRRHTHHETAIKFLPCKDTESRTESRTETRTDNRSDNRSETRTEDEPPENSFIRHPKLGIYFKMLQKKVPVQAVKQKMYFDKVSEEILNYKSHDIIPENILLIYSDEKINMLVEMENKKNKLKKTEINIKKQRGYDLGISLEDITKRLFGLKKTNLLIK